MVQAGHLLHLLLPPARQADLPGGGWRGQGPGAAGQHGGEGGVVPDVSRQDGESVGVEEVGVVLLHQTEADRRELVAGRGEYIAFGWQRICPLFWGLWDFFSTFCVKI